jgi:hypothetical protein
LSDNEVTVYDNGSGQARAGRALWINISGTAASVTEEVTRNPGLKSVCCGSARRTGTDWVISWGGTNTVGVYNLDGSPRLELSVDLATTGGAIGFSYQFAPIATGSTTVSVLRADMNR